MVTAAALSPPVTMAPTSTPSTKMILIVAACFFVAVAAFLWIAYVIIKVTELGFKPFVIYKDDDSKFEL